MRCVTRNLGRRTRSSEWLDALYAEPDTAPQLVLLQELPAGRLRLPEYIVALPETLDATSRGCRSAVLIDSRSITPVTAGDYLHAGVLGNYVARVEVEAEGGGRLTVVSVHASPNPLTPEHWMAVPERLRRQSEQHPSYADVVGDDLIRLLAQLKPDHVLAAGDFNEAYGWDSSHDTDSSAEFFCRLIEGGYVDATQAAWQTEVATQTAQPYQVDRIFGSSGLSVHVDPDPAQCVGSDDGLSDHLPLAFSVTLPQSRLADGAQRGISARLTYRRFYQPQQSARLGWAGCRRMDWRSRRKARATADDGQQGVHGVFGAGAAGRRRRSAGS